MGNTLSSKEEMLSQQGSTMAKCWGSNFPRITVFSFTQKKPKPKQRKQKKKQPTKQKTPKNVKKFRKHDPWEKKLKELVLFCLENRRVKGHMITVFQYEKACWRQIWWTVPCGHGEKDEKLICSKEDFRAMQKRRERVFSLRHQSEQWTKAPVCWRRQCRLLRTNQTYHGILLWCRMVGHFVTLSSPWIHWIQWVSLSNHDFKIKIEGCKSDHYQISQLELNFCS